MHVSYADLYVNEAIRFTFDTEILASYVDKLQQKFRFKILMWPLDHS
jgi:hypothetical protein